MSRKRLVMRISHQNEQNSVCRKRAEKANDLRGGGKERRGGQSIKQRGGFRHQILEKTKSRRKEKGIFGIHER